MTLLLRTPLVLDAATRIAVAATVVATHPPATPVVLVVRDGLAAAGLRPVSHAPYHSNSVTPAFVADGMAAPDLRKQLQAFYGIAIAGAQGEYWKAQMIRIGHLGFVYPGDLVRCLRALRILQRSFASSIGVEGSQGGQEFRKVPCG